MPPALASQPHLSIPNPITPNILNYQCKESSTWSKQPSKKTPLETTHCTVPFRDGLPTPPGDMTGVAYSTTASSNYADKSYRGPVHNYSKVTTMPHAHVDSLPASPTPVGKNRSYAPATKVASATEKVDQKKSTGNSIAPYLQIPSSINDSKGSLAEFAAQITCLFWFEKTAKLKAIEDRINTIPSLVPEAIPTIGFQKWVTTILSTTQVSQNVILLALMFIYRLKKFNPGVRGKKGSEFRLMTIALMMGNKFLDDNTYTNKTWAEVSGISVQEIHIMEVEFLSNVRYNLFVSREEWTQWHVKLGLFADYFEKASRMPMENEQGPTTPVLQISPNAISASGGPVRSSSPATKLPSPPATGPLPSQQSWNPTFNGLPYQTLSPQRQLPEAEFPANRKRNWDEQVEERPAKRMAASNNYPLPVSTLAPPSVVNGVPTLPPVLTPTSVPSNASVVAPPVPRLPRPNFQQNFQQISKPMVSNVPASSSQLPLPAGHAMSSVYNPSTTWPQQLPTSTTVAPAPSGIYNPSVALPDPGRRQSPFMVSSATASPALSAYSVHTPQKHLSPSFLANRNSPYRPVRGVNTLLIPPPSGSLHHPRNLSFDQMHYQPLGKTITERKTGVLPYLHHEAWPQGQIAQPNFLSGQNYST
ncbi:hypothetical protein VTN00DRAFT_2696 [Thermoascus crustaceus]|uniref:uncharacterized protein n=1 Tax=Thermoascus crustaceus TaxID=5088 RepID=UPI00374249F1